MAASGTQLDLSLLPIFIARLQTLRAIAPGLHDLPEPYFAELQSLLERAENLLAERTCPAASPDSASAPPLAS